MPSVLPRLALEEKELLVGVPWSGPDADGELQFLAPLAIGGTTIGELALRGTCLERMPHENVMLQLEVGIPGNRTRTALVRLEWRPIRQPHKDPSKALIWGSHVHPFFLNWLDQEERLKGENLPYAVEIEPDLPSFEAVIDFSKEVFRIKGLEKIEKPLWIERLF